MFYEQPVRVACLVIPHFQVEIELLARPDLRGKPLVVGGGPDQKKLVLDCSSQAAAYGISTGMQLRQALARCHTAAFLEAQPTLYEDVNVRIYGALYGLSPRVEISRQGCFYVDLTGLSTAAPSPAAAGEGWGEGSWRYGSDHLHPRSPLPPAGEGTEALLLERMGSAVEHASGIRPHAAVATGKFAAYAAALAPEGSLTLGARPETTPRRPGGVSSERLPSAVEPASGADPVAADGFPAALLGVRPKTTPRRPGGVSSERLPSAVEPASGADPVAADGFPAALLALSRCDGRGNGVVVPPDQVAAFVGGLSTEHLPVGEAVKRRLRLLGLKRLADVARLPKSALQAEFGPAGRTIWELSNGLDGDSLQALLPASQLVERMRFDEPLITTTAC